jgi:truncated hemoglobin YjbI
MEPTPSLYQRLGGEAGVKKLLVAFYGNVLADPTLKPFFVDVSMDKLLRMQEEFFGAALDGDVVIGPFTRQEAQRREPWGCAALVMPLGTAHAHRRTLAAPILGFARSMLPPLRHPGSASEPTPAPGHGQPLARPRFRNRQRREPWGPHSVRKPRAEARGLGVAHCRALSGRRA